VIIDAHILSWNEEMILPYTLDHYSKFCRKIYVHDNMSMDSSDSIYKMYPKVVVRKWHSNDEINELNYVKIKSDSYRKYSRDCDWVIVCDCDEFLYHPDLLTKLSEYKKAGVNVPRISGHDMVSESFPTYKGEKLTDLVKTGSKLYETMSKNIIFDPKLDVTYGIGGHSLQADNMVKSEDRDLKLLHYKFLGFDYVERIYRSRAERLSFFNKVNKFGEHYFNVPLEYMRTMLKEDYQVI